MQPSNSYTVNSYTILKLYPRSSRCSCENQRKMGWFCKPRFNFRWVNLEYRNAIFSPYLLRWFKPKMGMVTMSDCTCFNWELLTKGLLDGFPIVYTYTITTHLKLLVRGTIPKCKIYFWGPPLNVNLVAERPPVGRVFKIPSKCKLTFSSPPSKTPWQY